MRATCLVELSLTDLIALGIPWGEHGFEAPHYVILSSPV